MIAAAAIIMISVFGSFVLNGDPTIKQFGVGPVGRGAAGQRHGPVTRAGHADRCSDARVWWLPRWLAKLLPHVDIEGEADPPTPEPAIHRQRPANRPQTRS